MAFTENAKRLETLYYNSNPQTGKNQSDPLSYRPISLTSNLNKSMEEMVNNRLEKHKLYNPNQSGFRKNRNTGTMYTIRK